MMASLDPKDANTDGGESKSGFNLSPSADFKKFKAGIQKLPILSRAEEVELIRRWQENGEDGAAEKLITSHLRMIASMAAGFKSYGMAPEDLISEGCVGMVQAINRFDSERGFRLSTYARWWIRAAMQEFIMQSYSLVKIGTTGAQKKLFFNLRKMKNEIKAGNGQVMAAADVETIMRRLNVRHDEVQSMNCRMTNHDLSLNRPVDDEFAVEWQDRLVDDRDDQEQVLAEKQVFAARRRLLADALDGLDDRERRILIRRRMTDDQPTLGELGREFSLSPERIRQIEKCAYNKVQGVVRRAALAENLAA